MTIAIDRFAAAIQRARATLLLARGKRSRPWTEEVRVFASAASDPPTALPSAEIADVILVPVGLGPTSPAFDDARLDALVSWATEAGHVLVAPASLGKERARLTGVARTERERVLARAHLSPDATTALAFARDRAAFGATFRTDAIPLLGIGRGPVARDSADADALTLALATVHDGHVPFPALLRAFREAETGIARRAGTRGPTHGPDDKARLARRVMEAFERDEVTLAALHGTST
ncbi:MAG: hypothetical protein U0169_07895 [Polyangiaceae bacterium]